jgi:ABC-2 type transport system permease protein
VTRTLRSEWTKVRTLRANPWLLFGALAGTIALGVTVAWAVPLPSCTPPAVCREDTVRLTLSGVYLGQIAVILLATLAVTNEYATRMVQTTLAASPKRLLVYAARAIVVTMLALVAGAVGVLGALGLGRLVLVKHGFPPLSLADAPTARAAVGTMLYFGLLALFCVGIGTAVRHTPAALSVMFSALYVVPMLAQFLTNPVWQKWVMKLAPMTAGLAVQATERLQGMPIGPWPGLGVFALYAAAALALGAILFVARDA